MIPPVGREGSPILLVGDYATKDDFDLKEPLSKWQFNLLKQQFDQAGIKMHECIRTLFIKDKLEYSGKAKKPFNIAVKKAIAAIAPRTYTDILRDEIKSIKPTVVVPLGDLSLYAVLKMKISITKLRGSIFNLPKEEYGANIKVIPLMGPRYWIEEYRSRAYSLVDIKKIARWKNNPDPFKSRELVWVCRTGEALYNFIQRSKKDAHFLAFDIETYHGIPSCISFSFNTTEACSVPLIDESISLADRLMMWRLVADLLASDIPKVNQNIKYDHIILERFGFPVKNVAGDTALAAHTLYPELPKGLYFLTSLYTDMPYYKDEGKDFDPRTQSKDTLYLYNAKDSVAVQQVYNAQLAELEEMGLTDFYHRVQKLYPYYKKIDTTGFRIDLDRRSDLIRKYKGLVDYYTQALQDTVGYKINPNSPIQLGKFIYEELKFKVFKKRKTVNSDPDKESAYDTSEDRLQDLMVNYPKNLKDEEGVRALKSIIGIRKLSKVLDYASISLYPDGRLRTSTRQTGTETGRTSGGQSLDRLYYIRGQGLDKQVLGMSFQVFPKHGFTFEGITYGKDLRSMIIPDPGYLLVEGDLSQAEARVIAVLSEDFDFLEQFDIPPGVHKMTAGWLFDMDPKDVKKGSEEYALGKMTRHAANLAIGPGELSLQTNKSVSFCTKLLAKLYAGSPKIKTVFHREIRELMRNPTIVNPFGRRRDFLNKPDEDMFKEMLAQIPQSTVSDRIKFSMPGLYDRATYSFPMYESHDALLSSVQEDKLDDFCKVFKEEIEQPIDFNKCTLSREFLLTIPTELEYTDTNWMEMKPYEFK